ncbi:M28 family metallopeptidase [Paenibacillus xylanexedens]|uniref:M28 family metallopeptidase n=1 Tax=Paenibacillus xylanexedens TaxID=528191 RepID=UPI0011A2106E|nr:M28 family peptidase [Paenibacillus xylanexedens]
MKRANRSKSKGTNLILTIPGESTKKQIIVGAHYDGTGNGDNGSGVALLIANAKYLAAYQPPYTVKFIFFDAEEVGLMGSTYYVDKMSFWEKQSTLFMVNVNSIAFGDYPNIYGGVYDPGQTKVIQTEAYDMAVQKAEEVGMKVWSADKLDGYFHKHGRGPESEPNTFYTNPWTTQNPPPNSRGGQTPYVSPANGGWGDHAPFAEQGITLRSIRVDQLVCCWEWRKRCLHRLL